MGLKGERKSRKYIVTFYNMVVIARNKKNAISAAKQELRRGYIPSIEECYEEHEM